jgi:hypothetical protein
MGERGRAVRALVGGMALVLSGAVVCPPAADAAVVICKRKNKLKLREDACTSKEEQIQASELGVTGPQGLPGDPGAPGAPGLSGVEVVTANGPFVITFTGVSAATASCPAGKSVIGGGVGMGQLFGSITTQQVRESRPVTTDPQGWYGELEANVSDDWQARVYAVCATVTP